MHTILQTIASQRATEFTTRRGKMTNRNLVAPTLVKLYASVVELALHSRLLCNAVNAADPSKSALRETLLRDVSELDRMGRSLASAMHELGVTLPADGSLLKTRFAPNAPTEEDLNTLLRDLVEGHTRVVADIGFLRVVTTANDWESAGSVLSELNDTCARLALDLERHVIVD